MKLKDKLSADYSEDIVEELKGIKKELYELRILLEKIIPFLKMSLVKESEK
jgi:hypothetical protein